MMALYFLFAYLVGSFPSAYLIVRWQKGIDIRTVGSGNVGATNVFRTVGKKWGTFALLLDMAKGFLVTFFLAPWANRHFPGISPDLLRLGMGIIAILGHTWPIWLCFQGGKGVATSCGVFLGVYPFAIFISVLVWIGIVFLFRYVSLASVAAAFSFPLLVYLFYPGIPHRSLHLAVALFLALFICYMHRSNLSRLFQGTEHKIGKKK